MLKVLNHKFYIEDPREENVYDYLNLRMDNNLHLDYVPSIDMPKFVQAFQSDNGYSTLLIIFFEQGAVCKMAFLRTMMEASRIVEKSELRFITGALDFIR